MFSPIFPIGCISPQQIFIYVNTRKRFYEGKSLSAMKKTDCIQKKLFYRESRNYLTDSVSALQRGKTTNTSSQSWINNNLSQLLQFIFEVKLFMGGS
jgi:deoxyribodipyrimidine photolyase